MRCPHCGRSFAVGSDVCADGVLRREADTLTTRVAGIRATTAPVTTRAVPGESSVAAAAERHEPETKLAPVTSDIDVTHLDVAPLAADLDATVLASASGPYEVESVPEPASLFAPTPLPGTSRPHVTHVTRRTRQTPHGEHREGPTGPLDVGQSFGERYRIIRLLGIGGMGAVYQAWDAELEVALALKVIRPHVTEDPHAAEEIEHRFKRELLLARQVTHPNVVRIHDLGEIDGIKYITMPYIEGKDLSDILAETGTMPVPRALHIAKQVAAGLVAAHEAGVIHRDLKPANIMIGAEDHAQIMDFGIARSAGGGQHGAPGSPPLAIVSGEAGATRVGTIVGTLDYMAPEQARGEAVDQRADLYAFGLIVHRMLVGKQFAPGAAGPFEDLQARMQAEPQKLREIDETIPEPVESIVSKCLQPDPDARFQTTGELLHALERLDENGIPLPEPPPIWKTTRFWALATTLMVMLVAGTWWFAQQFVPTVPPKREAVSVLVADFANKTGEKVFDGAVEQTLGLALEGSSFIANYRRADALRAVTQLKAGTRLDEAAARLVASREGIKVVVTGSVEQADNGYALTAAAVDATGKVTATSSATARDKTDVVRAVNALSNGLRTGLGEENVSASASRDTVSAASLEALHAYAQGLDLARFNKTLEAIEAYQRAIRLDPDLGRAYAGLAVVYYDLKDEARGKTAYEAALKRVDRMTEREKLRTLGTYYLQVARNYEKAIENYEMLLKAYPADSAGHGNLAIALMNTGNLKRAVQEAKEVVRIYPKNYRQRRNYAMYLMWSGQFDDAILEGTQVVRETSTYALGYLPIALSMAARGEVGSAGEIYKRMEAASPSGADLARLGRADLAMYQGRYREALALLEDATTADTKAQNTGQVALDDVFSAETLLALGQKAHAAAAARQGVTLSDSESVLVPAALVLIEVGRLDEAEKIAARLEDMLQVNTTAYSRLIDAELSVARGRSGQAVEWLRDSIRRLDSWPARFLLGRIYARAGHFAEAMAELEIAVTRRGEATDVFIADTPTLRYLPPAYYWLARSQQAMGVQDARKAYEQFLQLRAKADSPDPLVEDARARLASLGGSSTPAPVPTPTRAPAATGTSAPSR